MDVLTQSQISKLKRQNYDIANLSYTLPLTTTSGLQLPAWELGTASGTDGSLVSSTTRIRSSKKVKLKAGTVVGLSDIANHQFNVTLYALDTQAFISQLAYQSTLYVIPFDCYGVIVVKRTDNADLTASIAATGNMLVMRAAGLVSFSPSSLDPATNNITASAVGVVVGKINIKNANEVDIYTPSAMYVRHVLAYDQDMKPLGYPLTNNTTNSVVLTKDKLLGASYIIVAMRTADSSNLKVSTLDGAFISVKSPITDRLQMLESNVQYKLTPVTNANASLFNLSDSLTFEKGYRYLLDINSKSGWQFSLVNCAGGITYASANGTPTNWFGKLLLEVDSSISAGLMFQKLDASKSPIVLDSSMLADVGFTITKYKAKNWNTNAVIIAAANSSESDKNVADIVCDGYADEMDINAAVLFFDKKSGEILVANGDYWIDNLVSVTDEETRFYGIYLPKLQREIIIKGKNHNHKVDNNSFNALDNTATIHLSQSCYDAIGSTDKVSLIGSYPAWAFPYNLLGVENVSITLPDNKKNIVCIDGKYMADMYAKGVFIKTDASYTSDTGVNPKCVGIRGVQGGNVGYNYYIKHCKFIGLGTAYHLGGEHLVVEDCIAQRCYYAYAYGNVSFLEQYSNRNTGIHNTTLINCCAEYCKGIFTFGTSMMNTNAISVVDFNIEEGSAGAAWNTDWIYKEESPGAFHGSISYYSINSDTWVVSTRRAWAAGQGKTFKTVNLIAPRTGTTAQRPTNVDYLFEYFDSTINKMIWWNDTAWMDASGTAV